MPLIEWIAQQARQRPDRLVIEGAQPLSWQALQRAVQRGSEALQRQSGSVAFLIDNGIDWLVTDLACLGAGRTALPLPAFFTDAQLAHALRTAGCSCVITDCPWRFPQGHHTAWPGSPTLTRIQLADMPSVALPAGTDKITFTSGSTGEPKGVCLSQDRLERTAHALNRRMGHSATGRHLCALPLAVLLENVAGIYRALFAGGSLSLWPLQELGMSGSSQFDADCFHRALRLQRAETVIVLPWMLQALVRLNLPAPPTLRFMAVGGAPLPVHALEAARRLAYPVYEGYGLSECGSVVSLNAPGRDRSGSVGQALDHVTVSRVDGEIRVSGNACLGYVGQPPLPEPIATGDLGRIDDCGFITIEGRATNRIVTAFGRNVSPEWVETTVLSQPGIQQCFVTGHGLPALGALLVAESRALAAAAVQAANRDLPDYARIRHWATIDAPFSQANHCLTANGRLRRAEIEIHYRDTVQQLFQADA